MKILFITDLYPVKENEKNTPKTLFSFVQEWKNSGHEVKVLKPNFLLNSFLRHKPFYRTGQYENVYNANYITPFLGNVKQNLPEFEYDVIVAHMPSGVIFSNHFSGKVVCGVHVSDIEVLTNPIYRFYFKPQMERAYKNSVAIACRSEVLKQKFLKLYPQYENKTFVCPSGIDFEPKQEDFYYKKEEILKIVACANLIKRKNIEKLINAVKSTDNVKLTVIGDGIELKNLKKIANEKIEFTGHLEKQKVLEYFRKSNVFLLPSINETFGMVYLEAMACGCITVCTEFDGIDGIIKSGETGFVVKPEQKCIVNFIEKIKNTDTETLNAILKNCYKVLNYYNMPYCAEKYIQNILKNI